MHTQLAHEKHARERTWKKHAQLQMSEKPENLRTSLYRALN